MKTIKGDLIKLSDQFDVIIHGCNCFHTMGAGIAYQIKNTFPKAYNADLDTEYGSENKLGTYSKAIIGDVTVVNAYTQFHPGKDVNYEAIKKVFKLIKKDFSGKKIAYPAIGSGIAGGDWNLIYSIICEELKDEDHTFVEYCKE